MGEQDLGEGGGGLDGKGKACERRGKNDGNGLDGLGE